MLSVSKNSLFGFAAFAIPTLALFVAYPIFINHLGVEAFGVYLLATSLGGALAFLDFGISTATLKFIAEDIAYGRVAHISEILTASLIFYGVIGFATALTIFGIAPWLPHFFGISQSLQTESIAVFRIAGFQFMIFLAINVFISLFKALHRFDKSTLIVSLQSVFSYGLAALLVLLNNANLFEIAVVGLSCNIFALLASWTICASLLKERNIPLRFSPPPLTIYIRMLKFGVPMTINAICGFLLYQLQQYLIGALLGPSAVSIYRIAATIPSKAHAVVNSATEILFPLSSGNEQLGTIRKLYLKMLIGSGVFAATALIPLAFLSHEILTLWINSSPAQEAAEVMPLFCAAYFFLALSPAPFHVVNGLGRPWINTAFFAFNAVTNVTAIVLLSVGGTSLFRIAIAFLVANVLTCICYQIAVERMLWRENR